VSSHHLYYIFITYTTSSNADEILAEKSS